MKKLVALLLSTLLMTAAGAVTVTKTYEAVVDKIFYGPEDVYINTPMLGWKPTVGTVVTGLFSYDTGAILSQDWLFDQRQYRGSRESNFIIATSDGIELMRQPNSPLVDAFLGTMSDEGISHPPPKEAFSILHYGFDDSRSADIYDIDIAFVFNHVVNGLSIPLGFSSSDIESAYLNIQFAGGAFVTARLTSLDGSAMSTNTVPEPRSVMLWLTGLAALLAFRRRTRAQDTN